MMALRRIFAGSVAVVLVAGCFNSNDDEGCNHTETNGLANNATFKYECSTAADPTCDPPNTEPPLPDAIALGARFRLSVANAQPVEPVSTKAVARSGKDFIALRTGDIGFVLEGANGEAVDAVRLKVEAAVAITIAPPRSASPNYAIGQFIGGTPPLVLAPSQSTTVRAIALRAKNLPLAGTIPVDWSIDDSSIASFQVASDGTCYVTANDKGHAVLTAKSGGLYDGVEIFVDEPAPDDGGPGDAGADASDAGNEGDAS